MFNNRLINSQEAVASLNDFNHLTEYELLNRTVALKQAEVLGQLLPGSEQVHKCSFDNIIQIYRGNQLFNYNKVTSNWANITQSISGVNLIDLGIHIHGLSQPHGHITLARILGIDLSPRSILLNDKMAGWNQKIVYPSTEPNTVDGVWPNSNFGLSSKYTAEYNNPDGTIRGYIHYFMKQSYGTQIIRPIVGLESIESYSMIHNRYDGLPRGFEKKATLFFNPPYPIFNAYGLAQTKSSPIIIAQTEEIAINFATDLKDTGAQQCTCISWPGGDWTFKMVDWWGLKGRGLVINIL
ncbi:MAG: hypothetical protein LBT86_09615 [Deltaproteobacteria bacterium]|jgi:hypothetical protein|nr:hypothetical protein [Deltaproteobacteria bacterium]